MDKIIVNEKVAIAISPGFGSGWTTCNSDISPFEPKIIKMIEEGRKEEITPEWCEKELVLKHVYCGGVEDLEVEWIPIGTKFYISEYDGHEEIVSGDSLIMEA